MKKIKIGVADDNQDFCDVVRDYVRKQDNMEIIFTASDGIKAMEILKDDSQCPDILILDLIMPSSGRFRSAGSTQHNPIEKISESHSDIGSRPGFDDTESNGNGSPILSRQTDQPGDSS